MMVYFMLDSTNPSGMLGEELVASYLYQVHLYHWLETNGCCRFLVDGDLWPGSLGHIHIKLRRFKPDEVFAYDNPFGSA